MKILDVSVTCQEEKSQYKDGGSVIFANKENVIILERLCGRIAAGSAMDGALGARK